MVYLLLGMHKSGTTLIAQSLHKSGINMGLDLDDEAIFYDKQKCESMSVRKINYSLLNCENIHSLDIRSPEEIIVNNVNDAAIKEFIFDQENNCDNWGFKDPRTVLTYDIWKRYLPKHKIIVVYRYLDEVISHYIKGIKIYQYLKIKKVIKRWIEYNNLIIKYLSNLDPHDFSIINYSQFMDNQQIFNNLQKFIGKELIDMRNVKMYRSKANATTQYDKIEVSMIYKKYDLLAKQ